MFADLTPCLRMSPSTYSLKNALLSTGNKLVLHAPSLTSSPHVVVLAVEVHPAAHNVLVVPARILLKDAALVDVVEVVAVDVDVDVAADAVNLLVLLVLHPAPALAPVPDQSPPATKVV